VRSIRQQPIERPSLGVTECALGFYEMPVFGRDGGDGIAGAGGRERGVKLGDAKGRQRVAPA